MTTSFIYDALLGEKAASEDPGATSLIRNLLRAAANTSLGSSTQILSTYSIIKTARLSCDGVDDIIQAIDDMEDDDETSDAKAWQEFRRYVEAIRKLEKLLLKEQCLFDAPEIRLDTDTVVDCEVQMLEWEHQRTSLDSLLEEMRRLLHEIKKGNDATPHRPWERNRDDVSLLQDLRTRLQVQEQNNGLNQLQEAVSELLQVLPNLEDGSPSKSMEQDIVNGIKGVWAVYAATREKLRAETTAERKRYLGRNKVYDGIKSFVEAIDATPSNLKEAYNALITILKVRRNEPIPNQRYIGLVKASKNVRRPFMYQNLVLMDYCHQLVDTYNSSSQQASRAANETEIISALMKAMEAVSAAIEAHPDTLTPDWKVNKKLEAESSIAIAVEEIKACMKKYDMDIAQVDLSMNEAKKDDDEWLEKLKDKCNLPPSLASLSSSTVSVVLKRHGTAAPATDVPEDTKVGFLVWKEIQEGRGQYTKAKVSSKEVDLNLTVKEAANGNSTLELDLE